MIQPSSAFHSVGLYHHKCKGCTICVTGCPAEAIRVRNGKAVIMEERCIDCGECIRYCPHKAKYAASLELTELQKYPRRAALLTPSFYGQFPTRYTINMIHAAVFQIGFTDIFDVAEDTQYVTQATADFLTHTENRPHPIISSSCPAIIKLIQIRFPSLVENLLPIVPPVEITARRARRELPEGSKIFLISPCPAKITAARVPLGYSESEIDGSFSVNTLYVALLSALKKNVSDNREESVAEINNAQTVKPSCNPIQNTVVWSQENGESECLSLVRKTDWLSSGGIPQAISVLETIEAGQFSSYEFAEIAACNGGCLGGPLNITCVPEAKSILRERLKKTAHTEQKTENTDKLFFTKSIVSRPGHILDTDFSKARKMLELMEHIISELPGLDCGSCGAPNCRALAEDIVHGNATKEDCVTIMKAHYEELLFGKNKSQ